MGALRATEIHNVTGDFLQLRQQLKERIRSNRAKESGSDRDGSVNQRNLPCNNFGSFFGPSENSIAKRLIEESKGLMPELKNLASRVTNSDEKGKKKLPEVVKSSGRKLKESRDYSFLFSENAVILTAASKGDSDSGVGKDLKFVKKQNLEEKERQPMPCAPRKQLEEKQRNLVPKQSSLKDKKVACAPRKQLEEQKGCQPKKVKSMAQKVQSPLEHQRKLMRRQTNSYSKNQIKCRVEEDSDGDNVDVVSSVIDEIFGRRRKLVWVDDDQDDDRAMVSSFKDILREEKNSAKIAREEDEKERLLIEQEEKQERLRKAKKQKLRA